MTGVKIGDLYKLKYEDGKVKVERDEAKIKAKKPVCARKRSPKTKYRKAGKVSA